MKRSLRLENSIRRPEAILRILTFSLASLLCCAVLISAMPASGAGTSTEKVKKSGKHNMNLHTKMKGNWRKEIVKGQVTKVMPDGIVMDGESFKSPRLQDDYGAPLSYADIYVGLTATVVYDGSWLEKIVVYDLKRPMVIKDKKYLERERARARRGR